MEAELEDERKQKANAVNSRKKLENDIKDLQQQAELATRVKEVYNLDNILTVLCTTSTNLPAALLPISS
jgi:hypothetical protein